MKNVIVDLQFISYDGKYPCLCSGMLVFKAMYSDGSEKIFEWNNCIYPDKDIFSSIYDTHDWTIDLPTDTDFVNQTVMDFTPMVILYLTKIVNENVTLPCCRGCS